MINSPEQDKALQHIKDGHNVAIFGAGGVGKSHIIRQAYNPSNTLLCAPTGIAAINIKGATCHSVFGLPFGLPTEADKLRIPKRVKQKLECHSIERIIIDEVGMLRADMLDMIDLRLKKARGNRKPFGGVQMVLVGDPFQLEPIVSKSEEEHFYRQYQTPFFFGAKCWKGFDVINLHKVFRQEAQDQIEALNAVRKGNVNTLEYIHSVSAQIPNPLSVHLCARKAEAKKINDEQYAKLDTPEKIFKGYMDGAVKWDSGLPVEEVIRLRVGAKVLIAANGVDYRNGDTGVVESMTDTTVSVTLDRNKNTVLISIIEWQTYKYQNVNGTLHKTTDKIYYQLPLRMGWAITIHASQGMTLDYVALDIGDGCFAHGQLYVALSRIRDLRNLYIVNKIKESDVIVNQDVVDFFKEKYTNG